MQKGSIFFCMQMHLEPFHFHLLIYIFSNLMEWAGAVFI